MRPGAFSRLRRRIVPAAAVAAALAVGVGSASGQGPAPRTTGADCRVRLEAVFWTGDDWNRLAQALAAEASPCAEYWISIPPRAMPKTELRRPEIFAAIRDLGPQFHPVAEMTLGTNTGWARWVETTGKSWFEAGVEFRKRMAAAGLDPSKGETWILNELDRSTRVDAEKRSPVEIRQGLNVLPYRRDDMLELLRGLYLGDGTQPPLRGAVEIGINFSHQNLPDVPTYKAEMAAWLEDGAFWTEVAESTRWLLREAYPDSRMWGVRGSAREERRERLADYIYNTLDLAEAGPASVRSARTLFRRTYLALANAGYMALGGDAFEFVTGHGRTMIWPDQMQRFVSEQVYAMRRYNDLERPGARVHRLGFSWQPFNRFGLANDWFQWALDTITARLASSIRWAYPEGVASPVGACHPPGDTSWCRGVRVAGAEFTDAWASFTEWPG